PDPREDFLLRAREERLEFLRPQAESTHRVDSRLQPLRCLLVYTEALVERDREGLRFLRGVKGLRELIGLEESLRDLKRVLRGLDVRLRQAENRQQALRLTDRFLGISDLGRFQEADARRPAIVHWKPPHFDPLAACRRDKIPRPTGGLWNRWKGPGIMVPMGRPTMPFSIPRTATVITTPTVRAAVAGLLRLARPLNCVMSAVGVGIGGVVGVGSAAWGDLARPLVLAAAAAAAFTAGGNALNDIVDRETDRMNHPDRPLASGQLTVDTAWAFAGSAFAIAALLAVFINILALLIVALNVILMVSYEAALKARGAPGNVVIAYLVGSLFLFAGVSVFQTAPDPLIRTGILAALAFLATLGREITKDIEDMRGDVDRRTLPQKIGANRAGAIAALALALAVALSFLPLVYHVLGVGYAILVAPADGMFIYAALHSAANPARSERVTKYAMIVALAAFLAGAFL